MTTEEEAPVIHQNRPTIDQVMMATAYTWSTRSTCPKRHVGAVISRRGRVLATGYNGAPAGQQHCTVDGCLLDGDGDCVRAVHAEANAIAVCAKHGVALDGAIIYITAYPCPKCAQIIAAAGIQEVIYDEPRAEADAKYIQSRSIMMAGGVRARRMQQ